MLYQDCDLPSEILKAVEAMGFEEMTQVQEECIPLIAQGKDVTAKAPTGTGKTCAFGIPLLTQIQQEKTTQGLILAPTRELAQQITEELLALAKFMPHIRIVCLYGGQPIIKQVNKLKNTPQIVVATPGRLLDHIQRKTIAVDTVKRIVLDEADEMLNMGFYKDVLKILEKIKNKEQLCMFSATISREVMDIGWLYQKDPIEITVAPIEESRPNIAQYSLLTTGRNKLADLAAVIVEFGYQHVIVFCNTKYTTAMLSNQLARLKFNVDCLHGDLSQKERNSIMEKFREGKINVLVATDVAARGIDVEEVDAVFNYDIPPSNEYYTHRIGRTGRAQREGVSYVFYTEEETKRLKEMLRLTKSVATPVIFDENRKLISTENKL